MPGGQTSLQLYTPTVYTAQVASAYKANIDGNSSIVGNPSGALYVAPNNPAGLSVLVDPAFNLWSGAGTNAGPILFNLAASPITVSVVAPGANSYYATIYWNPTNNTAGVVYGATGAAPFPILPDDASFIPLACVLLTVGQSQVQANNIFDIRNFWQIRPVKYSNQAAVGTLALSCAGATVIAIDLLSSSGPITLPLTNLQVGVPFWMSYACGATSRNLTLSATTPGGVAYTLQQRTAGTANAWAALGTFSPGASVAYSLWGVTEYIGTSPYLRLTL